MNSIAAIPLKSCNQCSHYRGGYCYGFGTAKKVFSTAEAIFCDTYTPLGQVQIGPLDSLRGALVDGQIPSGIISTLKLADLSVTAAKLGLSSVSDSKVAAAAAIVESKLSLNYPTHSNSLDHAQSHTLASHSTKAHAELTDVTTSQHHVKTVSGEISLADLLEKNHANLTNVSASQHHPKYLDSEAVSAMGAKGDSNPLNHDRFTDAEALAAAVKSESFGSGWSAEPQAPTEGRLYDHLSTKSVWPTVHFIHAANGALVSAAYGAIVKMPPSDADCWFAGSIRVPDWWPASTQAYLKVLYYPTVSSQGYSVTWSVGANGVGDSVSHSILNGSTGYDFPAGTGSVFARLSVDIGTSLSAQDVLTMTCTSDASNSTEIRIYAIWISTSSG